MWIAGIMMMAATPAAVPMPAMDHAAACAATPAPLPPELAGWSRMVAVAAGADAEQAPALALGVGAKAALLPTQQVRYALRPGKPGASVSSGGLFAFVVPAAGRYRVALGSGAWIDVVQGGKLLVSVAHGHGPDCSGVRKMVDFDLQPGRFLLQIAGSGSATLPLMIARLP